MYKNIDLYKYCNIIQFRIKKVKVKVKKVTYFSFIKIATFTIS